MTQMLCVSRYWDDMSREWVVYEYERGLHWYQKELARFSLVDHANAFMDQWSVEHGRFKRLWPKEKP